MGRPRKYVTKEERNEANRPTKNKYMLNTPWICSVCGNRDYSLAGKWNYLKHMKNAQIMKD